MNLHLTPEQKRALVETLKEAGRVASMALVSWGIAKLSTLPETEATIIGILLLKLVDRGLHEWGKATGNTALITGITRY